jgi:cellulose biosynthesis protein BcsQ
MTVSVAMKGAVGMATTLAVSLGKGGTMKTSVAANLAGLAAVAGWRVLAIDADRQGHLTIDLGVDDQSDAGLSLKRAVTDGDDPVIVTARPGLDVICGGTQLDHITPWMVSAMVATSARQVMTSIARVVEQVSGGYDLVVIDCPPGERLWLRAIYVASRWVLVPSMVDAGSRAGLDDVGEHLAEATSEWGAAVDVLGVVLTGIRRQATAMEREAREAFEADLTGSGIPVLSTVIHDSRSTATTCRAKGQLVHELEEDLGAARGDVARSGLAGDYEALAAEVLPLLADNR